MSTAPDGRELDHHAAATAFVERVREADVPGLVRLYLFGSVVRGEAEGLGSDVDVLALVDGSDAVLRVRDRLGEMAYDVMLSLGPVVEVHVQPVEEFDERAEGGFSFERRVAREGRRVV